MVCCIDAGAVASQMLGTTGQKAENLPKLEALNSTPDSDKVEDVDSMKSTAIQPESTVMYPPAPVVVEEDLSSKMIPDAEVPSTPVQEIAEAAVEDQPDILSAPVIDSSAQSSNYGPEIEARELATESNVDHVPHSSEIAQSTKVVAVAKPDVVSDLVIDDEDKAPPQKTVAAVEVPKSPSPVEESIVDEVALRKTLADLGLSPAPLKFPKRFAEEKMMNDSAAAQAPTTPTKESSLEILSKSPVLSNFDRVKTKKVPTEEKLVSSDSKGSEDSSGSHEGQRSVSSGKGNGGTGESTTKRRKKKRGKKSKGPKTNMH